jgi:hypothetical protein
MSDDLISFLSEIQISIVEDLYSYVYFDKNTGKIEKISRKEDSDEEVTCLKVNLSDVEDLINGKKRLEDYRVLYNSTIKDFQILELEKNIHVRNINNSLLKIEKLTTYDKDNCDIIVQQNNITQSWNFIVNKNLNFLKNVNDVLFFSITKKNDPNILYRTILVNVSNLTDNIIQIPYVYNTETDLVNVSVFTNKVLDTYIHEVIND